MVEVTLPDGFNSETDTLYLFSSSITPPGDTVLPPTSSRIMQAPCKR